MLLLEIVNIYSICMMLYLHFIENTCVKLIFSPLPEHSVTYYHIPPIYLFLCTNQSPEPESPSKWLAAEDLRFLHNLLESDKKVGLVGSRNPSPADTWSSATDSSPTSSSITTSVDENEVDTDEDVRRKLEWDDDGESNYRNAMKSPRQRKKKR